MDDGLLRQWREFAAARTAAFEGHNARTGADGPVHAVASVGWHARIEIPVAACRPRVVGGELAELEPSDAAVDCPHCLAIAAKSTGPAPRRARQPTLF
jgi:hypothetical protein